MCWDVPQFSSIYIRRVPFTKPGGAVPGPPNANERATAPIMATASTKTTQVILLKHWLRNRMMAAAEEDQHYLDERLPVPQRRFLPSHNHAPLHWDSFVEPLCFVLRQFKFVITSYY